MTLEEFVEMQAAGFPGGQDLDPFYEVKLTERWWKMNENGRDD